MNNKQVFRKLMCKLFGYKLVIIRYYNNETHYRLATECKPEVFCCYSMSRVFRISKIKLLPGGKVEGKIYVHEWKFFDENREWDCNIGWGSLGPPEEYATVPK